MCPDYVPRPQKATTRDPTNWRFVVPNPPHESIHASTGEGTPGALVASLRPVDLALPVPRRPLQGATATQWRRPRNAHHHQSVHPTITRNVPQPRATTAGTNKRRFGPTRRGESTHATIRPHPRCPCREPTTCRSALFPFYVGRYKEPRRRSGGVPETLTTTNPFHPTITRNVPRPHATTAGTQTGDSPRLAADSTHRQPAPNPVPLSRAYDVLTRFFLPRRPLQGATATQWRHPRNAHHHQSVHPTITRGPRLLNKRRFAPTRRGESTSRLDRPTRCPCREPTTVRPALLPFPVGRYKEPRRRSGGIPRNAH